MYMCVIFSPLCVSPRVRLGRPGDAEISASWAHVCPKSEIFVPSRVKGVNQQLEELSPFGGLFF